jgi:multicomponent Na+:H+ antiporter subunit G
VIELLIEIAAMLLAGVGAVLILVAGVGILRLPDLLTRMHASSKAGTLGTSLILLAVAVYFEDTGLTLRIVLIVLFLFLTAPVAAHMIARAGYRSGVRLSEETVLDEYAQTSPDSE